MQAVILCGGKGTRMREETEYRPKPLVEVGGRPIIWHVMKTYSHYGIRDFILCVGYKGDMIKQYFIDMHWRNNDFTLHTDGGGKPEYHTAEKESWNVTVADTGPETPTGGRITRVRDYIAGDEFMLTYGDGLSDVDVGRLLEFHRSMGRTATLTGVRPVSPFGVMKVEDGLVKSFKEKPILDDWVNGGYMVLNKKVFAYIPEKDCPFEEDPLRRLAEDGQLAVYEHRGFWSAIDTFKDVEKANDLWNSGKKPWKIWN